MELHFISTGPDFPYPYYLAVITALKTQKVSAVNIWLTVQPGGNYFDLVKDKVKVIKVEVPDFPALVNEPEGVRAAHIKDYLQWKILYERGGLCLDLDVLCIKGITDLLVGEKLFVFRDSLKEQRLVISNAVVAAYPRLDFMKALLDEVTTKLNNQGSIRWIEIGPEILMKYIKERQDEVVIGDRGLGGLCGGGIYGEKGFLVNPNARIVHLFAKAKSESFNEIDENYIEKRNTLYSRLVKQTLTKEEWDTRSKITHWSVENWLLSRGQHYKPMFDYLISYDCFNILEIGTFNGDNAIGMIKTAASRVEESKVHYYGFDLFEELTPQIIEQEFSLSNTPSDIEVKEKIEGESKAKVTLFKGNTRETLSAAIKELPEMDFIYIDGGHSIETVRNDWQQCSKLIKPGGVVFFDDFLPEIPFIGCKFLLNEIDKSKYDMEVLPSTDSYPHKWGHSLTQLLKVQPKVEVETEVVPYKISSRFISEQWFEKLMSGTLDMYLEGEDLRNSPLSKTARKLAPKNRWHWSVVNSKTPEELEERLREREKSIIELYHSMKEKGYDGSIIGVFFDSDGQIHLADGFNRMAIMKYLGIETDVNVDTIQYSKDFDFPLADTLMELPRIGKCTYQPIDDGRVKDFPIDRPDSLERLEYIINNLTGETVLDIGCAEGYFSRELAKRGYSVTAVDSNPGMVAVTRYLSTINNLSIKCYNTEGEELLKKSNGFDNVLYLSVFHNWIYYYGVAKAFMMLRKFRGKAKRVFFEVPDTEGELYHEYWEKASTGSPLFHFKGKRFEEVIKDATGMKILEVYKGYRPIYLLGEDSKRSKEPLFKVISEEEWLKHNKWEKNWWKDCSNTYDEQVKQELYVKYMKLEQYASKNHSFDLKGKSVIDIGGGPISLLLRCENFKRAVVVDPCDFPKWVADRYKLANIEYYKEQAENINFGNKEFDEAWIYNVLQHVRDPLKVIEKAKASAKKIRVFEAPELGVHPGHPHNLTKEALDEAFGKEGLIEERGGKPGEIYYYGVFNYG